MECKTPTELKIGSKFIREHCDHSLGWEKRLVSSVMIELKDTMSGLFLTSLNHFYQLCRICGFKEVECKTLTELEESFTELNLEHLFKKHITPLLLSLQPQRVVLQPKPSQKKWLRLRECAQVLYPVFLRPAPNSQASGPSHACRKLRMCNTTFGEHLWSTQIKQTNTKIVAKFIWYLWSGLTWMDVSYLFINFREK